MDFFKEHVAYLKNNPEGYWFKRKLYGYGWVPAKWQGWAVMGVYLAFVFFLVLLVAPTTAEANIMGNIILPIGGATILLVIVSWKMGEPLKWQWGKQSK